MCIFKSLIQFFFLMSGSKEITELVSELGDEQSQLELGTTPKFKRLLGLLSQYTPKPIPLGLTVEEQNALMEEQFSGQFGLRGVIFVERRGTTEVR